MHKLNLLPKEILARRKRKRLKLIGTFLFIAVLIVCVFFYKWISYKTIKITKEIENTLNKSSIFLPVLQDEQSIDIYLSQSKIIFDKYQDIEKNNRDWSDIISKILSCMTDKTTLTFLSITEDNHLILKGSSLETVFIASLLKNLEHIDSIENVSLSLITHDDDLYVYEISATIKSCY